MYIYTHTQKCLLPYILRNFNIHIEMLVYMHSHAATYTCIHTGH